MGIVILRSMGGEELDETKMEEINLAGKEEIRRIVNRSLGREKGRKETEEEGERGAEEGGAVW